MWRIWVAALFWGLNWPSVKIILSGVSPWTLRSVGLAGGAACLAAAALVLKGSLAVPRKHWWTLVVASLLGVVGFNVFAVFAQLNLPTSRAAILTFTMPYWSALFAWIFLGERIDRLRALALVSGAAGLVLLSMPFWPALSHGEIPVGLVYVLGAAISWAAGTVYLKAHPIPVDPAITTAWQISFAAVICTFGMLAFETPRFEIEQPWVAVNLAYHMIFPQALSYLLWFSLVGRVPASTATLGTLLVPIFGVAGAMVALGERPEIADFAGFALILAGVGIDQGWRAWRPAR